MFILSRILWKLLSILSMQSVYLPTCHRLLALLSVLVPAIASIKEDYSQYVNALMGSEGPYPGKGYGGGDIFVGGARPFGVAKVGIDTTAANWSLAVLNGGWTPDGDVTAISR